MGADDHNDADSDKEIIYFGSDLISVCVHHPSMVFYFYENMKKICY